MNNAKWSDEVLMAYADGALPEAEAAAVHAAALAQPEVAARIELFRASRQVLRGAFEPLLQQPVPPRLLDAVQSLGREGRPRPRSVRVGRRALAMAASLLLVLGASLAWRLGPGDIGGARQMLAAAAAVPEGVVPVLDRVPSGELTEVAVRGQPAQVLTLASYDDGGVLCREFELSLPGRKAERALACRQEAVWRVRALARPGFQPAGDAYLPASGQSDVAATVGLRQPLSPEQERRLLERPRR